ncbi:E3 ubiquitin-protein ligase RGLG2-like [Thraustotheca clavata]|uniref:E3 ubiquitin-protein ligase RGLG2-like n=1 Tax=Thraustotheca clavata TaxID=74557 RepID=A0A1V9ZCQ2_9STRA|nr:E3 ubiquitin-protein ligase RGLG2-like [Thraustotheca clavata]
MGNKSSAAPTTQTVLDEEVFKGHCMQVMIGIDFSKSNEWTGKETFKGKSLHELPDRLSERNPYENAILFVSHILEKPAIQGAFDELIPCFGFGDSVTKSDAIFSFMPLDRDGVPKRKGYKPKHLCTRYRDLCNTLEFEEPTSYAPIIQYAASEAKHSDLPTNLLIILTDGRLTMGQGHTTNTNLALEYAAKELDIVILVVGDGPHDILESSLAPWSKKNVLVAPFKGTPEQEDKVLQWLTNRAMERRGTKHEESVDMPFKPVLVHPPKPIEQKVKAPPPEWVNESIPFQQEGELEYFSHGEQAYFPPPPQPEIPQQPRPTTLPTSSVSQPDARV